MADQTFAVNSGFYDAVNSDRTYSADDMNRPYKRLVSNGVFATPQGTKSTDLQVVAAGGMQIIVKTGEGIFADKWFENPAAINITVPSNTSTSPRIDSVIVQVDKRTSGRVGNIVYRTGTPSSNPSAPAINTTENVIEYRIANVRVAAGAVSITGGVITDRRGSSDCPWITSLIYQVDTSTLYDQWAAAYVEYFEAEKEMWDDWYSHLTEELDVSMTLAKFTNTVITTSDTSEIDIGISDFNFNTDILEVYINGLKAIEGVQYTINDSSTISLTAPVTAGQVISFVVLKSVIMGNAADIMSIINALEDRIASIQGGNPTVVDSVSDMTDTDKIYILSTDSEWYYYNLSSSEWVIGGTYGGVPTDTTLTQAGMAADAKTVGDAINPMRTATSSDVGKTLKAKTVSDGKVTEWEFGDVTVDSEAVDQAVSDWLDDHPEATTTVQDGSITDIKNNDSLKYLFYDDVTTETGRTSETDYYIVSVPAHDTNNDVIDLYLDYDSTVNPLEYAGENTTTLTVNGYGKVLVNGEYINGIAIGKGDILNSTSLFGLVANNYLYVGIKADRSITEYQMSSNVTPAQMLEDGCVNVFNSYFKLVENGQIVSGLSDGTITINGTTITETMRNPLMLMGVKDNKDIVFMACDGRTAINKGLTYREAGELLISHGCTTVYNLDGGGSTTMIVKGSKINRDIDDNGTSIRDIHYTLNVKKQASNAATQSVYAKIGEEKQRLIEQIIPYVNNVQDSLITKIGYAISENDDVNDYLAEGKFYCSNATIAQSLSHCPVSIGFSLYCLQQGGTGRVLTQIIITNPSSGEQSIYYRSIVKDTNGTFSSASDWGQFLPDLEVVTLEPKTNVTINRSKCTKSARTVTISAVFTTSAEIAKNSHLFAISSNAVPGTTVDFIIADTSAVINFAVAVSTGYINVSSLGPLPAGTYRMNVSWQV